MERLGLCSQTGNTELLFYPLWTKPAYLCCLVLTTRVAHTELIARTSLNGRWSEAASTVWAKHFEFLTTSSMLRGLGREATEN